jgi:hypothetical protein
MGALQLAPLDERGTKALLDENLKEGDVYARHRH